MSREDIEGGYNRVRHLRRNRKPKGHDSFGGTGWGEEPSEHPLLAQYRELESLVTEPLKVNGYFTSGSFRIVRSQQGGIIITEFTSPDVVPDSYDGLSLPSQRKAVLYPMGYGVESQINPKEFPEIEKMYFPEDIVKLGEDIISVPYTALQMLDPLYFKLLEGVLNRTTEAVKKKFSSPQAQ